MESRGLAATRRRSGAALALDRRRRRATSRRASPSGSRRSGSASRPTASLLAQYQRARRRGARAGASACPPARRLVYSWDAIAGLPAVRLRRARQRACPTSCRAGSRTGWPARRPTTRPIRLLASVVAFPLFWGLETWLVFRLAGARWALAFALSLPLSGADRVSLSDRGRLAPQSASGSRPCPPRQSQAARRLVAEREAIVAELERARNDYLTATKGSSF